MVRKYLLTMYLSDGSIETRTTEVEYSVRPTSIFLAVRELQQQLNGMTFHEDRYVENYTVERVK